MGLFGKTLTTEDIERLEKEKDVAGIIEALKNRHVYEEAARVLASMMGTSQAKDVAKGFIRTLREESRHMRLEALTTLELMTKCCGPRLVVDAGILPALDETTKEVDEELRDRAEILATRIQELMKREQVRDLQRTALDSVENVIVKLRSELSVHLAPEEGDGKGVSSTSETMDTELKKVLSQLAILKSSVAGTIGLQAEWQQGKGKRAGTKTPTAKDEDKDSKYCSKCGGRYSKEKAPKFCSSCGEKFLGE